MPALKVVLRITFISGPLLCCAVLCFFRTAQHSTALAGIAVVRVAWLTISVPRKKVSIALHHAQLY